MMTAQHLTHNINGHNTYYINDVSDGEKRAGFRFKPFWAIAEYNVAAGEHCVNGVCLS